MIKIQLPMNQPISRLWSVLKYGCLLNKEPMCLVTNNTFNDIHHTSLLYSSMAMGLIYNTCAPSLLTRLNSDQFIYQKKKEPRKVQQSRKSNKCKKEWPLNVAIQAYKVCEKLGFMPTIDCSKPLNVRLFHSFQKTHMVQRGMAFQISYSA